MHPAQPIVCHSWNSLLPHAAVAWSGYTHKICSTMSPLQGLAFWGLTAMCWALACSDSWNTLPAFHLGPLSQQLQFSFQSVFCESSKVLYKVLPIKQCWHRGLFCQPVIELVTKHGFSEFELCSLAFKLEHVKPRNCATVYEILSPVLLYVLHSHCTIYLVLKWCSSLLYTGYFQRGLESCTWKVGCLKPRKCNTDP